MAEKNRSRANRPGKPKRRPLSARDRLSGDLAYFKQKTARKKAHFDPNDRSEVNHKIKRLARRLDAEELDALMNGDPGDEADDYEIEDWFRRNEMDRETE